MPDDSLLAVGMDAGVTLFAPESEGADEPPHFGRARGARTPRRKAFFLDRFRDESGMEATQSAKPDVHRAAIRTESYRFDANVADGLERGLLFRQEESVSDAFEADPGKTEAAGRGPGENDARRRGFAKSALSVRGACRRSGDQAEHRGGREKPGDYLYPHGNRVLDSYFASWLRGAVGVPGGTLVAAPLRSAVSKRRSRSLLATPSLSRQRGQSPAAAATVALNLLPQRSQKNTMDSL